MCWVEISSKKINKRTGTFIRYSRVAELTAATQNMREEYNAICMQADRKNQSIEVNFTLSEY